MHLPAPIQTYFNAQAPKDGDAFAAAFAPDAIVHDEGHVHRRLREILVWWQAVKTRYRSRSEPLELNEIAGRTVVRARVTGEFPGSPVVLTFTFALAGDQIAELEIR